MNTNLPLPRLRSEDLVRIADNVPQLIWISDSKGLVRWCNRALSDYLCQPSETVTGKEWQNFIRPDEAQATIEKWRVAQERGEAFETEIHLYRFDEQYRLFLLCGEPQFETNDDAQRTSSVGWIVTATDIEDLRSLRRDYDSILRSIPDVISRVGRDGKILSVSPNVEGQNGWSIDKFVGKNTNDAPLWDNQPEYARLLSHVFESGTEADFEYQHHGCFYRARLLPEKSADGEIESVLSITEDITDARRLEAEAVRNRQLFDGLGDATPGLIYLYDVRLERLLYVSGGATTILGYSPSELQTFNRRELLELINPDDFARISRDWMRIKAEGEVREAEFRLLHSDTSWHWIHSRDVLFARDANGKPAQILGVAIDITQRREAEDALRVSEERLRRTVNAVQLGTWDWFVQEERIIWNEWHWRLFGLEPGPAERKYEEFEQYVHPDDRQAIRDSLQNAICERDGFTAEFRVQWPDGSQHWIAGQGNVSELDAQGEPTRMIGVIFDITARKEAEEALQQAHDELEKRVEERTAQLQSTVAQLNAEIDQRREAQEAHSHLLSRLVNMQEEERRRLSRELHDQFGQTLTAMLMAIDAGTAASSSPSGQSTSDTTRVQARLRIMVEDLMDQIHQRAWELRPASLDNLGLLAALRPLVSEWRGVEVDFITRGLGETRLPAPLEIAFYRIIQEALTNIARHAQATQASVVLEKNETHVVAIVEDNGVGFDIEHTREERLGLLGMRERMDAVGGTLEIETSPGSGTSVFARAPLVSNQNTTEKEQLI